MILSLFILALLLLSCAEKTKATEPLELEGEPSAIPPEEETQSATAEVSTNETTTAPTPSGPCQAGWVCLSSSSKIYRLDNCSFAQRVDCKFGCLNDECKKPELCTPGFKCAGEHYTGYQLEDCSFISKTKCEWGCENAECLPQPNETTTASASTTSSSTTAETASPPPKATSLKAGETGTFKLGGIEHTIKIYNLEGTRVRLEVDGQRSDWVDEGKKVTFASGLTIKVAEILYRGTSSSLPSEIGYVVE